ncbi:glucan endo-1,3-beta-glucosidase-like [Canna indica]|uniref:Glucan endo-1,3-beta-glucosidase-like n=1 Tax=Canna indica TaxID=4628 RepID=A0AAQ3Q7E7_9LILI|nr:glucan endo-1,3-beta-glucosidase-like [Canna indica]
MQRLGYNDVEIAMGETGWPSAGDPEQLGVSVEDAASYNANLICVANLVRWLLHIVNTIHEGGKEQMTSLDIGSLSARHVAGMSDLLSWMNVNEQWPFTQNDFLLLSASFTFCIMRNLVKIDEWQRNHPLRLCEIMQLLHAAIYRSMQLYPPVQFRGDAMSPPSFAPSSAAAGMASRPGSAMRQSSSLCELGQANDSLAVEEVGH